MYTLHTHVHLHMHIEIYICTDTFKTSKHMQHANTYTPTYASGNAHICKSTYIHIDTKHIHAHIYICTDTHAYINSYTHAHMHFP